MTRGEVRTATTNAGSLRTGDVLAQGFAGLAVTVTDHDGSAVHLRTYSLQTGEVCRFSLPTTSPVTIVHPDDHGRALPTY